VPAAGTRQCWRAVERILPASPHPAAHRRQLIDLVPIPDGEERPAGGNMDHFCVELATFAKPRSAPISRPMAYTNESTAATARAATAVDVSSDPDGKYGG